MLGYAFLSSVMSFFLLHLCLVGIGGCDELQQVHFSSPVAQRRHRQTLQAPKISWKDEVWMHRVQDKESQSSFLSLNEADLKLRSRSAMSLDRSARGVNEMAGCARLGQTQVTRQLKIKLYHGMVVSFRN